MKIIVTFELIAEIILSSTPIFFVHRDYDKITKVNLSLAFFYAYIILSYYSIKIYMTCYLVISKLSNAKFDFKFPST